MLTQHHMSLILSADFGEDTFSFLGLFSVYSSDHKKSVQDNNFGAIIVVCLLVLSVPLVRGKVYKSMWLNILNFSFFMNLILLMLSAE